MAQKQSCAVCRGDRPLYEKKPSPPDHFKIWIRDGVLSVDGTLANLVHRKKELVPIFLSCRIFYCPVCGAPVGVSTPSRAHPGCGHCSGPSDWIQISAPASLRLYFCNERLHLLADLGYIDRNCVAICSYCEEIPIHFCMACGRRVSKLPSVPLGTLPNTKTSGGLL